MILVDHNIPEHQVEILRRVRLVSFRQASLTSLTKGYITHIPPFAPEERVVRFLRARPSLPPMTASSGEAA